MGVTIVSVQIFSAGGWISLNRTKTQFSLDVHSEYIHAVTI